MQTLSTMEPNEDWQKLVGDKIGRCLDFGCGYGADAFWFAKNGWLVDAIDSNNEIKFQHPNLNFINADFRRLDLLSLGKYDFVIACFSLHFFNNLYGLRLAKILFYLLKPGGILYIKTFEEDFTPQWQEYFSEANIERYEKVDDHRPAGEHIHKIVKIICRK